ncbi:MAG TPA: DUF447 domain-containing protein [Burkholderiaceae bacterium]|nr:DUF447 domain-containing protein [Burkholderiaceae bacterium]
MAELIYEAVITTCSPTREAHVAPMGVRYADGDAGDVVLMPFKPSTTLRNIESTGHAVLNFVTDVRVFAGCVTGRRHWPTVPVAEAAGVRLACALGHVALALIELRDHEQRPVLRLKRLHEAQHAPFIGFNRAQAAVVEGAVLVSRLHLLPIEKIDTEMRYLQIAIDKTAGPVELEAWDWLQQAIASHRQTVRGTT